MSNFNRPPRIQPELPIGETEIPAPPQLQNLASGQNLLIVLLPGLGVVAYILVGVSTSSSSGTSPILFILPMVLGIGTSVIAGILSYRRFRTLDAKKQADYANTLNQIRQGLNRSHDQQREYYFHTHPNPGDLLALAKGTDLRLWERRPTDEDFGVLRIGVGLQPSSVTVKMSNADTNAPQYTAAQRILTDFSAVKDVPIALNLRHSHSIGIVGSHGDLVKNSVRSLLMEFALLHAPTEARLFVVGTPETKNDWQWARWLPHANSAKAERGDGDQLRFTATQIQRLWTELGTELDRRASRQAVKGVAAANAAPEPDANIGSDPFLLVVVDATSINLSQVDDENPLSAVQTEGTMSTLLKGGQALNAAVIFVTQNRRQVPADCRGILEIETDPKGHPAFRYAEVGLNSTRRDGRADQASLVDADALARALAPLEMRTAYGSDLPSAISLLQMISTAIGPHAAITDIEHVPIWENWQKSMDAPESWPKVALGARSNGKLLELILNAPEAGNHGLIAGTTGSGKSEMILTLIAWLAINYDPRLVNFVLVDYKGGTALDVFRELPHTVDLVTNLNASATARTFTALKAELRRRQTVLKKYGAPDIEAYQARQTARPLPANPEPMPHLFIIIDEFAEMIKDMPDFKQDLVSIAALGRSLGIHLLLATQKPDGVVSDQMRANMKFRICLRVERPEDSRELLRRPDAAFLPPNIPGRAYLQIGNERVELFQVGRTGGPYVPVRQTGEQEAIVFLKNETAAMPIPKAEPVAVSSASREGPKEAIVFLSDAGHKGTPEVAAAPAANRALVKEAVPTLSKALAGRIAEVAGIYGIPQQEKPWPDALPLRLYLSLISDPVAYWMSGGTDWPATQWKDSALEPVVGLLDDPARMEQRRLALDLPRGNVVIFGASGWGKTTFLRSAVLDLAASHSPADLHFYILDFGGQGLRPFEALPHVAAIVAPTDTERVTRLIRRLNGIIEERKEILGKARADGLLAYNQAQQVAGEPTLPAVVVILDNFAEFRETYADDVEALTGIARDGRAHGVYMIITADQPAVMPTKIYGAFTERYAMHLAEAADFPTIVGRGIFDVDLPAGRGYVRVGKTPLEFQTALPVGQRDQYGSSIDLNQEAIIDTADDLEQGRGLEKISIQMRNAWHDRPGKPNPITILERMVYLDAIATAPTQKRATATLGIVDFDLSPIKVTMHQSGPHMVVLGPPSSGRTTFLRTLLLAIAAYYTPDQVAFALVDFRNRLMRYGLDTLPHILKTASSGPELQALAEALKAEFSGSTKPREVFVLIDDYDLIASQDRLPAIDILAELARQYGTEGLYFVVTLTPNSVRQSDPIYKNVQLSRFALTFDANTLLELGVRGVSFGTGAVPTGRGFLVRSSQATLLQVATPQLANSDMESSILGWVETIKKKAR